MISKETLDNILGLLEPEDRIPHEGAYEVSHTYYTCSSTTRGGTYYDMVNNHLLMDLVDCEGLKGIRGCGDPLDGFSVEFNPEDMDEKSAEGLINFLEELMGNTRDGIPCIDERTADDLEYEDKLEAIINELEDIVLHDEGKFPEGFAPDWGAAAELMTIIDKSGNSPITIEPGPTVSIDRSKLIPSVNILAEKYRRRRKRFDSITSRLLEWALIKNHAAYIDEDDANIFRIKMPVIRDRLWVKVDLRLNYASGTMDATFSRLTPEKRECYLGLTYPLGTSGRKRIDDIASRIENDCNVAIATAEKFTQNK